MPPAWKNTFFWIAGILFIIAIIGLPFFTGDDGIRDPGQIPEKGLYIYYFLGSVIMLINGVISHKLAVQQHLELS
jgi:hypothetical protein